MPSGNAVPTLAAAALQPEVTQAQVWEQIERILSSRTMRLASRCNRLLRYLAEQTLLDQREQLKERAIGIAVYGKDKSFDPRLDALVRVGICSLRQKLDEYYRNEAVPGELLIGCRTGRYCLQFHWPASSVDQQGEQQEPSPT